MNPEKMMHKGQLAEAKHKYKELDMKASGLITLIRQYLNPYERDITKVRIREAALMMDDLEKIHDELLALRRQIDELEADLG